MFCCYVVEFIFSIATKQKKNRSIMDVETFNLKYESPVLILRIDNDISERKSNKMIKRRKQTTRQ